MSDSSSPPSKVQRDKITNSELPKGTVLGNNYRIEEVAGQGGMATVYLAIQKSLDRKVAVKVLHSQFVQDATFVSRFDAEAGMLANLQHPNVVSIIDRGLEDKRYYFVMEWVSGKTLDDRIIEKGMQPHDWPEIISGCKDGISYVHKQGVVHRDIKPSNILIGDDNRVKIGDFGIIHIITRNEDSEEALQRKKDALGTELYMAPEQESNTTDIDQRADVYSLGVTFFKMLTRRMPKENGKSASAHNSDVPVAVDAILEKALEKNRDDRYTTIDDFCNDLLKALKKESTSIASVLNKSKVSSSALYTGQDFTPVPRNSSSPENRLSKLTPLPISRSKKDNTTAGKKSPTSKTQKAKTSEKTAKNTTVSSSSSSPQKSKMPIIIGAIGIVIIIGVIAAMTMGGGDNRSRTRTQSSPPSATNNSNLSISEQRKLQDQEFLNQREGDTPSVTDENPIEQSSQPDEIILPEIIEEVEQPTEVPEVTPVPTPDIFNLDEE